MFDALHPAQFDAYGVLEFDRCTERPGVVLVHSSFIRCALRETDARGREAVAFLDHLDLVGTEMIFSAFTEFEILGAAHQLGPEAARRHIDAWREMLASTKLHWRGVDAISDDVPGLMGEFDLTVSGAVHVATAIAEAVDGFVTVEPWFGVVDKARLPLIIDAAGALHARQLRVGRDS